MSFTCDALIFGYEKHLRGNRQGRPMYCPDPEALRGMRGSIPVVRACAHHSLFFADVVERLGLTIRWVEAPPPLEVVEHPPAASGAA